MYYIFFSVSNVVILCILGSHFFAKYITGIKNFLDGGVTILAQRKQIQLETHEVAGSIPGLSQQVKDPALP